MEIVLTRPNAIMDFIVAILPPAVASNLLSVQCERKFSQSPLFVQVGNIRFRFSRRVRQYGPTDFRLVWIDEGANGVADESLSC
jgi:hypothetical protein